MAPPLLPVHFQKQEKPTNPKPGGPRGRRSMLLVDPVRPFAALGFEGLDLVPGLLHRAGHEAADGVFLPAHLFHNLGQRGSALPLQHGDHLGGLAALARRGSILRLDDLFALRRVVGAVVFLAALPLAGAPLATCAPRVAACAPPLAFRSAFGLAGWSAFGSGVPTGAAAFGATGSPNPWMRAQIRLMAVFRSLNFLTAVTPGRLFHTARSLSAGQWAARSANSCWLAKESNGVAVAAAASSWVANTLMLFSLSMVNVFIWGLSWHGVAVTLTFITPMRHTGKGSLTGIGNGEGEAMMLLTWGSRAWPTCGATTKTFDIGTASPALYKKLRGHRMDRCGMCTGRSR